MPFRRFPLLLLAFLLPLVETGCSHLHLKKGRKAAAATGSAPASIFVGTITLVDETGKFVLIDNGTAPLPPVGGVLRSSAAGTESAELVTTQVRRHPFTIADIRSGQPHKGDRVTFQPLPATPPATPAPATAPKAEPR